MAERLWFSKDAKGIHSQEGIIMAEGFVITYRFTTPKDKLHGYAYESKPYKTQAEAESYLQAVLARAIIKDVHIIDWQIWHGDQLVAQF